MADAFPLLRRIHLFISLTDDELRQLAGQFEEVTFPAEAILFKQNDPGDAFYVIQSGQVEITRATLSGATKFVSKLVAGDYFGEMALYDRRPRSATVKALTSLTLWKLSSDDFLKLIIVNPKIKPNLDVAIRSRNYARNADFLKMLHGEDAGKTDEIVYLATLQHRLFLWRMLSSPTLSMVVLLTLGAGVFWLQASLPPLIAPWAWGTLALLAAANLVWFYWNWVDFHNDWYIVTNKRIIDIDKVVFFFDSRVEVPLGSVSNTSVKASEVGRLLSYGDLVVNTFSGPIIFHNVPNPQATGDMILEHLNRSRIQQKIQEREGLKKMIRGSFAPPQQAALTKVPPPAPPPAKQQSSFLQELRNIRKQLRLDIRAQQGDVIVYHKHHYVLIQKIILELIGVVGVLFVLFLYTFRVIPFNSLGPLAFEEFALVLTVAVALIVLLGGAALYQFLDWRNDIYMVTANQIVDTERKPFGEEIRKAANLEGIMNVTYVRPSFLANLLNYGTVTIQAGPGGEMKFHNVFNPPGVQQDIYRRKEARATAAAAAAAKQRQEELSQYFSVFYEVLEEDRKKREGK